ncbi:MAG: hypothetical protein RSA81_06990, partial [Gordonibacter sp.]
TSATHSSTTLFILADRQLSACAHGRGGFVVVVEHGSQSGSSLHAHMEGVAEGATHCPRCTAELPEPAQPL